VEVRRREEWGEGGRLRKVDEIKREGRERHNTARTKALRPSVATLMDEPVYLHECESKCVFACACERACVCMCVRE
jgi:hypothetical protein